MASNLTSAVRSSILRSSTRSFTQQQHHILQSQATSRRRLAGTLAILEQRDGNLQANALHVISAATKLGNPVTAFVTGSKGKEVADQAAKVEGVDKVVYVGNALYDKVCTFLPNHACTFYISFCISRHGSVIWTISRPVQLNIFVPFPSETP